MDTKGWPCNANTHKWATHEFTVKSYGQQIRTEHGDSCCAPSLSWLKGSSAGHALNCPHPLSTQSLDSEVIRVVIHVSPQGHPVLWHWHIYGWIHLAWLQQVHFTPTKAVHLDSRANLILYLISTLTAMETFTEHLLFCKMEGVTQCEENQVPSHEALKCKDLDCLHLSARKSALEAEFIAQVSQQEGQRASEAPSHPLALGSMLDPHLPHIHSFTDCNMWLEQQHVSRATWAWVGTENRKQEEEVHRALRSWKAPAQELKPAQCWFPARQV